MKRFLVLLLFAAIGYGCAAKPYYYTPNPSTNKMDPIIEFSSNAEIALINNQPKVDEVLYNSMFNLHANYNKWTDVAIQIIDREITKRGMKVAAPAPKSMKVAVTYAKTDVGINVKTEIIMAVETDSGYKKEYVGKNVSYGGGNVMRQTDGALMRVVAAMLNDPEIIKFLNPANF